MNKLGFILSAVVDPSGTIPETNESNNENEIPVTITPITLNLNPSPLEVCDDNADGFAEFTLTDADNDITLGNSSLIVSYHPTVQNAEFDINPLPSNYTNTTPFNDEVFARVMNASETSAAVVSLDLIVNEKPPIVAPEELFIDEGDNDAMAIFDLTVKIPEILDGLDPTFHDVSFYETAANAQSNTNPISNPEAYANLTNPQTIFVRVDNNQTTCFDTVSFQIVTDGPLGLDDQFLNDFVVYPNPVSDFITLEASQMIAETQIAIFDVVGKIIFTETQVPQKGTLVVNLSHLKSGMYFLKVSSEGNSITKKLIIQ